MRKSCFIIIFLLIIHIANVYCINIDISDIYTSVYIDDNIMKIEYGFDSIIKEEYSVKWETVDKINYINFYYNGNFMGDNISHGDKRYLVLYNGYLIFYNNNNQLEYYILGFKPQADQSSFTDVEITASSELKEKEIIYKASNLFDKSHLIPWVEGVGGDGIGQRIKIEFKQSLTFGLYGFYISNGYIDYNKPYLYEYNNRIKRIRVTYIGHDEYKEFELEDTPNFQYINIGINYNPNIIWIEILEVYKGTRWDDTCINNIIPYGL